MITEELQKDISNCFNRYIELQKQADEDYENVKKIISESDNMLKQYEVIYDKKIESKNEELKSLQIKLEEMEKENEMYQKQFQNIPIVERDKYVKRRIY